LVKVREQVILNISKMIENKLISAPDDYKEEIFFTFQKLSELKDIDRCETKNICNEIAKIFRNDLSVTKNQCSLFVINSKESSTGKALSMRWQYQGRLYVAKTKCGIKRVSAVLVYENDKFEARYVDGLLKIDHQPNFASRGEIVGGYCVIESNSGIDARYYTIDELDKRRSLSQKQPVWENGRVVGQDESPFWKKWEREMYEKTLINATLNRIIESSGIEAENLYADEQPVETAYTVVDSAKQNDKAAAILAKALGGNKADDEAAASPAPHPQPLPSGRDKSSTGEGSELWAEETGVEN
jgi:recombinational DNA repair protein RecT